MTTDIRANGRPTTATRVWTKGGPVDTELLPGEEVAAIHERQEASIGEPAAMALLGFATGTFIIAYVLSGWVPTTTLPATLPPVLVFAGLAQFIGGLIAFRRENAFAGTAFCVFGANNVVVSTFLFMQIKGTLPTTPGSPEMKMLALEMFCFAYIALMLGIVAVRLNAAFVLILLTLCAGFALTGVADFLGTSVSPTWGHVGGYLLIASSACAAYTATAMVLNSTWERQVLPMINLGRSR
jgi:uncharacterized protein